MELWPWTRLWFSLDVVSSTYNVLFIAIHCTSIIFHFTCASYITELEKVIQCLTYKCNTYDIFLHISKAAYTYLLYSFHINTSFPDELTQCKQRLFLTGGTDAHDVPDSTETAGRTIILLIHNPLQGQVTLWGKLKPKFRPQAAFFSFNDNLFH